MFRHQELLLKFSHFPEYYVPVKFLKCLWNVRHFIHFMLYALDTNNYYMVKTEANMLLE